MVTDRGKENKKNMLLAVAINAAFLALIFICFTPVYETNDDFHMSMFVDGKLSVKTAYVPFINITQGLLLKLLYVVGGNKVPWYTIAQYAVMFLGFTAMSYVLLCRFDKLPAVSMVAIVLLSSGMDCYLILNFSRVAAIATVGGLALMLYAMSGYQPRRKRIELVLGFVISVLGFSWRYEMFFSLAAIMSPIGLVSLLYIVKETEIGEKLKQAWLYARPFVLLLAVVCIMFGVNKLAWSQGEYQYFDEYRSIRVQLMDNGMPLRYEQAEEMYQSIDLDENAVGLLRSWNFYDTENFSIENMRTILAERNRILGTRSMSECLRVLIEECAPIFALTQPFMVMAAMLLLWILCGDKNWRGLLGFALILCFFAIVYGVTIYINRPLQARVDMGLFMAVALALSFLLRAEKTDKLKWLCVVLVLVVAVAAAKEYRQYSPFTDRYSVEDNSQQKAMADTLLEDNDCLYLCKVSTIYTSPYTPFETAPEGYSDRLVMLGGWSVYHPSIEAVLSQHGIENPFEDMIDNDSVLLIDDNIELTVAYLQEYYNADARAEKLDELSEQTGLNVYRIVSY